MAPGITKGRIIRYLPDPSARFILDELKGKINKSPESLIELTVYLRINFLGLTACQLRLIGLMVLGKKHEVPSPSRNVINTVPIIMKAESSAVQSLVLNC